MCRSAPFPFSLTHTLEDSGSYPSQHWSHHFSLSLSLPPSLIPSLLHLLLPSLYPFPPSPSSPPPPPPLPSPPLLSFPLQPFFITYWVHGWGYSLLYVLWKTWRWVAVATVSAAIVIPLTFLHSLFPGRLSCNRIGEGAWKGNSRCGQILPSVLSFLSPTFPFLLTVVISTHTPKPWRLYRFYFSKPWRLYRFSFPKPWRLYRFYFPKP